MVDEVQKDVFYGGNVRSWQNGKNIVFLPAPDNDVYFVFTHFIKHFYKEGMCIRQICDWCRLLWTYRGKVNCSLLEKRLRKSGLVSEWRVFASLAVELLGMPMEAMPLYENREKWSRKASRLLGFILGGYAGCKVKDTYGIFCLFPLKTICYMPSIFLNINWLKFKERLIKQ